MDNKTLYPLVFDAIKDPVVMMDPAGAVLLTNASALTMFDFGAGRSLSSMRPIDGNVVFDAAQIRELMRQHESVRNFRLLGRDGRDYGVTMDIETIHDAEGSALRLLHFRSRSPEMHREFWKDEMISMVSHEIKNPLSAMKNSVEILLSQVPGELTDGQRRFLDTSGRSIQRLTRLVDGFLDVSRIHSGALVVDREAVDMHAFLGDVMRSFQTLYNVKRVQLDWHLDSTLGEAFVDSQKLEQVMINLLSNALKFTPESGEISVEISTAGVESMSDELRLLPWQSLGKPRVLEIKVRDTGLGMSTETLDNVFSRYYGQPGDVPRQGSRGAHLGLNITKALVEAQGGWIEIQSKIGIGTTVTVNLPQDRPTAALLARVEQIGGMLRHYETTRRPVGFYMIGKYSDDDWMDISSTWERTPSVNPFTVEGSAEAFHMWTLSSELAVAVLGDHRDKLTVDQVFDNQFVMCDNDAYVFSSYAIGACYAPTEATSLAQLFNNASTRMGCALDAMARSAIEKLDSSIECVTTEWGVVA